VEEVRRAPPGPFDDLEVIRVAAGMSTTRFCRLIDMPERTWRRWQARAAAGEQVCGPWPAPVAATVQDAVVGHAQAHPAWGHRKVWAMTRYDGHRVPRRRCCGSCVAAGCCWPRTTCHRVCQSTRRCRANAETVVSSWANAAVAQVTARLVRAALSAISGWVSDHVRAAQAGSGQRHTRLHHTTRTDNPKQARPPPRPAAGRGPRRSRRRTGSPPAQGRSRP